MVEGQGLVVWDFGDGFGKEGEGRGHGVVAVEAATGRRRGGGGDTERADAQEEEGRDVFVQDFFDIEGAVGCGGEVVEGEGLEERGEVCAGEKVVFIVGEDVVEEAEGLEYGGADGVAAGTEGEEGVDGDEAGFVAGMDGFFVEDGGVCAGEGVEVEGIGDEGG